MTTLPEALPIVLVLAVLVGMFVSVQRQAPSTRVRLWTYAWALTFLHFFGRAIETHAGTFNQFMAAFDYSAAELSGIVFLCSMLFKSDDQKKRIRLILALGAPLTVHAFAVGFNWGVPWIQAGLLGVFFLEATGFTLLLPERRSPLQLVGALALAGVGAWAVRDQLRGSAVIAVTATLMLAYGLSGVLFWRLYRRRSLGVIAVTAGFLGWSLIFPTRALLLILDPKLQVHLDLWNVPRLFVALGMVLTLFEDKSRIVEGERKRAQTENLLLEGLSQITSRLLAASDPIALCAEVAPAITGMSSFQCAALFLLGEDRRFYLASSSGFTAQEEETLREHSSNYSIESLKHRSPERSLGSRSLRISEDSALVMIPMVSRRGSHMGCLYVSDSKDPAGVGSSEMVKLELFAADLAVTFENVRLHQQLVRSEKLAGLGQLVAGVAHELNNPLTGVIGYTDLLRTEVSGQKAAARVEKLANEARRMQRIVDGLLRFGRQNNSTLRSSDLATALRDVVQLREYHVHAHGIKVDMQIDPKLPPVGIGEDELKQVLLNILNNAIDAVEESGRQEIQIHASHQSGRVAIQFDDSGPGFADLSRAFDPFYTTKPVGKGTGLGLSICYGIVQECHGEITLKNNQPYGSSVVIDLPVAAPQPVLVTSPEYHNNEHPLLAKRAG
ncbi:MAG: ATP-binding protein [Candidatus Acidiferrales bacterium]